MQTDAETLRTILLALERMERSPPEPIILDLVEFSGRIGASVPQVELGMARLADRAFIEGPGPFGGAWLFRRLTRKGRRLMDEIRTEKRWRALKEAYDD